MLEKQNCEEEKMDLLKVILEYCLEWAGQALGRILVCLLLTQTKCRTVTLIETGRVLTIAVTNLNLHICSLLISQNFTFF